MEPLPSSVPSAGGRRFWFTVFLFALANIAVWIGYHLWTATGVPRRDILTMQRFTPDLTAAHHPPLTWTFNLDVARPGPLEKPPGTIQPAINGVWLWTTPRTLAFQPAQPLPMATKYTATLIPAMLTTTEGFTLPAPITTTFTTTPLDLLCVKQAGFDDQSQLLLELTFNDKVIPAEAASHIALTTDDGQPVHTTLNGQAAGTTVRLLTDPLHFKDATKDHTLSLTLSKGLAGASGPLAINQDAHFDVTVSSVLAPDNLTATVPSDGNPELLITFNDSIEDSTLEILKPLLSVEPKVDFTASRSYRGLVLTGPFQPATRYAVTIAKSPASTPHGIREAVTLSTFIPDRDPAAFFQNTSGYLGSAGNRTILIKAVNVPSLHVTASRLYENNLVAWTNSGHSNYSTPNTDDFAHPLASHRYTLPIQKNTLQDLRINLDDLLGKDAAIDGTYQLAIHLDNADDSNTSEYDYRRPDNTTALVTLSDIGLTTKLMADPTTTGTQQALLAWAVSLSTGKPLADIHLRLYSSKNQLLGEATTGPDGLARIEHLNPSDGESPSTLIAQDKQKALTYLDLTSAQRNDRVTSSDGRAYLRSGYEAFLYTERGVYRPGETVTLRAIVRGKDLAVPPAGLPMRFQIRRPDGQNWLSQSVQLDPDGACEWKLPFPTDAQTGFWSAQLGLPGQSTSGSATLQSFGTADFQIEEFIPARIKTTVIPTGKSVTPLVDESDSSMATARIALSDDPLFVDIQSDYLFGQPAANLTAQLAATLGPTAFTTKSFPATDGWLSGDTAKAAEVLSSPRTPYSTIPTSSLTLDKSGHTQFALDLNKRLAPDGDSFYTFRGPWKIFLTGTTLEIGGRPVSAITVANIDALPYYVLVRPTGPAKSNYLSVNTPATYELRLVTSEGKLTGRTDAHITATVFTESWSTNLIYDRGHYHYQSTRTLTPLKTATDLPLQSDTFSWKPTAPGAYVIQFADTATHQITTTHLEVGQGDGWNTTINQQNPAALDIHLVAATAEKIDAGDDTPTFKSSQPIKALIHSPFPGQLLLTIETDTVLFSKVITMDSPSIELPLDLPANARPNGYVSATVIRPIEPDKAWRTHRAFGLARFTIDPADEKLTVAINAPTEIRPQTPLDIQLTLTTPDGQPAKNAAVSLAAVDEGILMLTDFGTPSPLDHFNSPRALAIDTADIYDQLMPEVAKPENQSATGGDGDSKSFSRRHSSPVSAKRVTPVSLISEIVHTDDAGHATVHLQVPEFLGSLRIMAVTYNGPLLGSADKSIEVRSPLVVQSSFPRFLAPGDRCDATFLLINNTKSSGTAHLQLTTDPAIAFDHNTLDIFLAADEQKTVTLNLTAQQFAGIAHIAIEATLNGDRFSEHLELPIRPASPAITRGDTLRITPDKDLALNLPTDLLPGTDSLQLRIASRPALNIPQGLDYLDRYPYGCLEQTTSQSFPLVYLKDLGSQISPTLFSQDSINRKIQTAIQRLMSMQTATGGLSMWPGETEDWPWGTVYAAHFLIEAEHAGYPIPADFKSHTLAYLHLLLTKSAEVGEATDLQAYALYVLALAGHPDRPAMNRLGEILSAYPSNPPAGLDDARFHLALAWAAAGRTDLAEQLIPATLPTISTKRTLTGNISSPITDQSLTILTLLSIAPDHPALPALAQRLSIAGQNRQWQSTQDNALAVMALGKYLRSTKDEKPFDTAALLDGEKTLATSTQKPLLWSGTARHLAVHLTGPAGATGFVSWLQTGVPLTPPPDADHALKIRRTYLSEDNQPLGENIPTGTAIKVQITIDSTSPLDNLVIEDLLPAGLEIENPRLATTQKNDTPTAGQTLTPTRLEVRDDRLIAVANIPAGTTTYTYLARAVTLGDYTLPPIRGECMYDPAINSLNGAGQLHITSDKKMLALR